LLFLNISSNDALLVKRDNSSSMGSWEEVGRTGVSAMHITLIQPTKILIIDKAEKNPDAVYPDGRFAFTTEYDLKTNTFRVLTLSTNTFCSAGSYLANGTLIESGGAEDTFGAAAGFQSVRLFTPCDSSSNTCDWMEFPLYLDSARWYNTMTSLPDGRIFNIGGSIKAVAINENNVSNPTYEFYPKEGKSIPIQFLLNTMPYNLYPVVIVLPGPPEQNWLYMAANRKAQIWDYVKQTVVMTLPDIPGGPRTYPCTGTSTLLPLRYENNYKPEIIACGGSAEPFAPDSVTDKDCVRLDLSQKNLSWVSEPFGDLPTGRLMSDVIHMPDGKLLFLNGAGQGYAGWDKGTPTDRLHVASNPIKTPLLYDPNAPLGSRFTKMADAKYVRVYHSTAMLIPDGRVFVAGSNPNGAYCDNCEYPTEYRVEIFTPPNLLNGVPRPTIKSVAGLSTFNTLTAISVTYGQTITVLVDLNDNSPTFTAAIIHKGFITHSQHMSARYVSLKVESKIPTKTGYAIDVTLPPNPNIMPPGRHIYLYVLNKGTPADTGVELNLQIKT
ncbi:13791_t:CDS:2, partial [Acaulospora morrowiae]